MVFPIGQGKPGCICRSRGESSQQSIMASSRNGMLKFKQDKQHTCWLIKRIAMSGRSVKSWKVASIVATGVSNHRQ